MMKWMNNSKGKYEFNNKSNATQAEMWSHCSIEWCGTWEESERISESEIEENIEVENFREKVEGEVTPIT